MSWTKGFAFRGTSGYVTDGANDTYVLATDVYPTTRNSCTFGWDSAVSSADRSSSVDVRLAGINYTITTSANQHIFKVALNGTGSTDIRVADGDSGDMQGNQYFELRDNTTVISSVTDDDGIAYQFFNDAAGNNRYLTDWPSLNTLVNYSFSSSTFNYAMGKTTAYGVAQVIAYIQLFQSGGGGFTPKMRKTLSDLGSRVGSRQVHGW